MDTKNRYTDVHCIVRCSRSFKSASKKSKKIIFGDVINAGCIKNKKFFQSGALGKGIQSLGNKIASKRNIALLGPKTMTLYTERSRQRKKDSRSPIRNQLKEFRVTEPAGAFTIANNRRLQTTNITLTASHDTRFTSSQRTFLLSALNMLSSFLPNERSLKGSGVSHVWYKDMKLLVSICGLKLWFAMLKEIFIIAGTSIKKSKCPRRVNQLQINAIKREITSSLSTNVVSTSALTCCKSVTRILSSLRSSNGKSSRMKFRLLPSFGTTSIFTLLALIFLETLLLSTVSNCAKTFYMHWNTSNSIFRIDNTDHIIDVNKGNLAFEFDQVHIICPVYEPGTFENETEKYIIYNVSKVEYETCRITNADPRVIAICDKPQKLMFFTITFRPFTPQPGGLEFLPGNDYYFISTSSKDDLYRRIGGRCSTNNMKVVFKVCCASEEKNKTLPNGGGSSTSSSGSNIASGGGMGINSADGMVAGVNNLANAEISNAGTNINQHEKNNINKIGINGFSNGLMPISGNNGLGSGGTQVTSASGTSINTNIDQFNRIPIRTGGINVMGNGIASLGTIGIGNHGSTSIMLTPGGHGGINIMSTGDDGIGVAQYPGHTGQTGIRVNSGASQHQATYRNMNSNDGHYDKHPNEVVKNEELTYHSGAMSLRPWSVWRAIGLASAWPIVKVLEWVLAQSECFTAPKHTGKKYNEKREQSPYTQLITQCIFRSKEKAKYQITVFFSIVIVAIIFYVLRPTITTSSTGTKQLIAQGKLKVAIRSIILNHLLFDVYVPGVDKKYNCIELTSVDKLESALMTYKQPSITGEADLKAQKIKQAFYKFYSTKENKLFQNVISRVSIELKRFR